MKLFFEAIAKLLFGAALVGLLIFLPAGTLSFFGGRLFMGILFIPMILVGIVMLFKTATPLNLSRVAVIGLMIFGAIVVSALFWSILWGFVALSVQTVFITIILAAASIPLMILFTHIIRILEKRYSKKAVDKI